MTPDDFETRYLAGALRHGTCAFWVKAFNFCPPWLYRGSVDFCRPQRFLLQPKSGQIPWQAWSFGVFLGYRVVASSTTRCDRSPHGSGLHVCCMGGTSASIFFSTRSTLYNIQMIILRYFWSPVSRSTALTFGPLRAQHLHTTFHCERPSNHSLLCDSECSVRDYGTGDGTADYDFFQFSRLDKPRNIVLQREEGS